MAARTGFGALDRTPDADERTRRNFDRLHDPAFNITPYRSVTATTTATINDSTIDCLSGTFTVNLPTAVGISGRIYVVRNSGAGTITVDAAGSELINGGSTTTIGAGLVKHFQSTGAGWITL